MKELNTGRNITMPKFSKRSADKLDTCDERLQRVFNEVIKHWDCTITEGTRSKEVQDEYFRTGKSKVKFPNSRHNLLPSKAVDAAPYIKGKGITWNNASNFYLFVGFVLGIAASMDIKLRVGADWDGDHDVSDQSFHDLLHLELVD